MKHPTLLGMELDENPVLGPAAGTVKTLEGVIAVCAIPTVRIIVVGSYTEEEREGNDKGGHTVFWVDPQTGSSLNTIGLKNKGEKYLREYLPEMVRWAHAAGKKLVVSVSGKTPEENARLAKLALELGADAVEVNLACPNVWNGGKQSRIAGFYKADVRKNLAVVRRAVGVRAEIWVKLPPYTDPEQLKGIATILGKNKLVKVVVSSNTFPNCIEYDDEGEPVISFGEGFAGYAGTGMRLPAQGQVKQLRKVLPPEKPIIGAGGVSTGKDAKKFILAGAIGVVVGTKFFKSEDPKVLHQLAMEAV